MLLNKTSKDELHLTKVGHSIAQDKREVILQVQLNILAQICTLREEHQMLQQEASLNNLICRLDTLDLNRSIILRNYSLLLRKITRAVEDQIATRRGNINLLTKHRHITTDFLEIGGRHMDDRREVEVRDLDILNIGVEKLQIVIE